MTELANTEQLATNALNDVIDAHTDWKNGDIGWSEFYDIWYRANMLIMKGLEK
jgi:hypothetical protein